MNVRKGVVAFLNYFPALDLLPHQGRTDADYQPFTMSTDVDGILSCGQPTIDRCLLVTPNRYIGANIQEE